MATERIQIQITENGSRRVIVNINRIGGASERSARQSNLLRNALGLLGGAAIIRGLSRTADEVTNIQNRLRLVTEDAANLEAVFDELVDVSNRSRTSFRENAELFTRTALATRELGLTQRQVLGFTESLSQAVILSGASAQEASNAIRQLSQGLQNGALRGEEFRSVSEQLPFVLEVIADDLGITRGRLRELAFEGELTAEIIVGAFERAAPRIRDQFGDTIPTLGQSFTVLRNSITELIDDLDAQTGVTRTLARVILFLAENIDFIARAVIVGAFVSALVLARNALVSLTAAAIANPFTAIAVGITAVIALLVAFQDEITLTEDGLVTLGDFFRATFQILTETVPQILQGVTDAFRPFLENLGLVFEDTQLTFFDILRIGAAFVDGFAGLFVGLGNALRIAFEDPLRTVQALFVSAINAIVEVLEFLSDSITSVIFGIGRSFDIFGRRLNTALISLGGALDQLAAGNFSEAGRFLDEAIFQLEQGTTGLVSGFGDNIAREFDRLRDEDVLARIEGPLADDARDLGEAIGSAITEGIEGTTGATDLIGAIEERTGLLAEQRRAEEQLREIRRGQEQDRLGEIVGGGTTDRNVNSEAEARSVFDGFSRGFDRLREEISDFATLSEGLLVNAFGAAEDALVEFVQTGEFNFSGFVDSLLADLTRLLARQALFGLLASFGAPGFSFGAAGASGFLFGGGGGGIPARQSGGPVSRGDPFLVGERGPELFVPPTSGSIVPNGGGQPEMNISIVNVTDPSEVESILNSQRGEELILNAISRNPDQVNSSLGQRS